MDVINDLHIKLPDLDMENFVQRLMLIDELELRNEKELNLIQIMSYKIIQQKLRNFS